MAEETKFPFRMYRSSGVGMIDAGFFRDSMAIMEVTDGSVSVEIGTETVEATETVEVTETIEEPEIGENEAGEEESES